MKDKLQGKGEEIKGKITDDPVEENKGKARQTLADLSAKAEQAVSNAEHRIEDAVEHRHEAAVERHGGEDEAMAERTENPPA